MQIPEPDTLDSDLGRVLDGRFELTEFVAKGGMGKVYKATQKPLDRVVAVKLLNSTGAAEEEFRKRFFLEASLCARLSHPNIVRIYDFGCDRGETYYIAMEFLEGETLKDLIRRCGPLDPARASHILQQVCAALVEAHDQGMVHRDLKSSNLMMCSHAMQQDFVKLVDFGIVKELKASAEITMTGALLGSPAYMSPEQINDTDVDARSDIYSLGIVLYQMLTGTLPFVHKAPVQILIGHLEKPPPSFAEANPSVSVPANLEAVVRTCLQKSREDRYPSARSLLEALQGCALLPRDTPSFAVDPEETGTDLDLLTASELEVIQAVDTVAYSPLDDEITDLRPIPEATEPDSTSLGSTILQRLHESHLKGYVGFIDFNCPFCFALYERMSNWGLADSLEWCMVEHASHIMEGPFNLDQEQLLSKEVVAVHHRAPDIDLQLPPTRCCSKIANRLVVIVQREFRDQLANFRTRLYHALWQQGRDIGDPEVLQDILRQANLPPFLIEMCDSDPPEIEAWQTDWENADFDCCIPVISHPASGRVLIGLATQRTLVEFLLQERSRVVDSSVCYYQQQPVLLVCGWMSHLWQLLSDIRSCCEILQAPSARHAMEMLSDKAVPDLLLIEDEHIDRSELEPLADLARSRSVHWALATRSPSSETEVLALSMGAAEYLPVSEDSTVARARLARILRDRFSVDRLQREHETDTLTGLTSRRQFILQLEEEWERALRRGDRISLILMDLDRFKSFNDIHGYLSGNQALSQIARRLRTEIRRPGDVLARFGGNEFAVLLPLSEEAEARRIAQTLRLSTIEARIEHGATMAGQFLSMSVGVSSLKASADTSIHELHDLALEDLRKSRQRR